MQAQAAHQQLVFALQDIYDPAESASIARIVFEDVFKVFGKQDRTLETKELLLFEEIKARLLGSEPVQYILGEADFYGLKLKVSPDVLIPRQETEELVYQALQSVGTTVKSPVKALDIGTGSGCIAIALKKKLPAFHITAIDLSPAALNIAAENADRYGLLIDWQQVDFLDTSGWKELPSGLDLIISNPPYIPEKELDLVPPHVLNFEPHLALFVSNHDPLVFYKAIAIFAHSHLQNGGWVLVECNEYNAKKVMEVFNNKELVNIQLLKDMNGKDRIVKGQKKN